jgi:hypothetical protein
MRVPMVAMVAVSLLLIWPGLTPHVDIASSHHHAPLTAAVASASPRPAVTPSLTAANCTLVPISSGSASTPPLSVARGSGLLLFVMTASLTGGGVGAPLSVADNLQEPGVGIATLTDNGGGARQEFVYAINWTVGSASLRVTASWTTSGGGAVLCLAVVSTFGYGAPFVVGKATGGSNVNAGVGVTTSVANTLILAGIGSRGLWNATAVNGSTFLSHAAGIVQDGSGQGQMSLYDRAAPTAGTYYMNGTLNGSSNWMDGAVAVSGSAVTGSGTVRGSVHSYTGTAVVGARVNLSAYCQLPATAATCDPVANVTTTAGGAYSFTSLPPALNYWVFTNQSKTWTGDSAHLRLGVGATHYANLTEQSYGAVNTALYVLPGWTNLSTYASNANCDTNNALCNSGTAGIAGQQVPLMAWSQDGVFYVNTTNELVFYSFANRSYQPVAPWTPLYQNVMRYKGIEDTEWITQDSQYVYTFGRIGASSTVVTAYWANVTTGRTWEYNFTGVNVGGLTFNAQVQMVGEGDNYSVVTVIDQNGTVHAYNFWNHTEWVMGHLAFFEANNVYWIPDLNSFLDVEANGSSGDLIDQYHLNGPAPGNTLKLIYSALFNSTHAQINGVDGIAFNVTSRTLAFTYQNRSPQYASTVFSVRPNDTINVQIANYTGGFPTDNLTGSPLPYSVISSEHRIGIYVNSPNYAAYTMANFYNGSFTDAAPNRWLGTNITYAHPAQYRQGAPPHQAWYPAIGVIESSAVEGMFLNATYGLVERSVDCRTNNSVCALDGNGEGAVSPGTVQYYWQVGHSQFPYPVSVSKAELSVPSHVVSPAVATGLTTANLTWGTPASGANPLLNYTVLWGLTTAYGSSLNVPATGPARAAITGLTPGATYFYRVRATNLHGSNVGVVGNFTVGVPTAPTNLAVTATGMTNISLAWNNPTTGGFLYATDTVWQGLTCASLTKLVNTSGPVSSYLVTGLAVGTSYCFAVSVWTTAHVQSPLSGTATATTLGPTPPPPPPSHNQTTPPCCATPAVPAAPTPVPVSCGPICLAGVIAFFAGLLMLYVYNGRRLWPILVMVAGGGIATLSIALPFVA